MSEEPQTTDEELAERARTAPEGDMRAFEQLVVRHQSKVVANCRYLTRSPVDAEDLAQEVFLKAYFGLKGFEGRSLFRTWIQRIKVNHCLNHLRKGSGKTFVDVDDMEGVEGEELSTPANADRLAEARDDRERIDAVLDSMSDTLRIPLVMREVDQFSYQEIADALGLGLSAVKMRIKRAREEFQDRFRGADEAAS